MKPKSKFDPHDPDGTFEVVVFSPDGVLKEELLKRDTAAVKLAKKLLKGSRVDGVGAAVFYHDGTERRGLYRSFKRVDGQISEDDHTKVIA